MKFRNDHDAQLFLIEMGVEPAKAMDATKDMNVSMDLLEMFISARRQSVYKLKSFRRSQASKEAWRSNRYKYMKGIRTFHKSTEGKRFHRNLGKFLASRETFKSLIARESFEPCAIIEWNETLKALSSLKTHLFIEFDFYRPVSEEVDLHILLDEALPAASRVEKCIVEGGCPEAADLDLLMALTEPRVLAEEVEATIGRLTVDQISEILYPKDREISDTEWFTTTLHGLVQAT